MLRMIFYNFKIYFRVKENFIWNLLFPFVFTMIYVMAMSAMSSDGLDLPKIDVAIVEEVRTSDESADREGLSGTNNFPNYMSLEQFFSYLPVARASTMGEEELVGIDRETLHEDKPFLYYTKAASLEQAQNWLEEGKIYAIVYTGKQTRFEVRDTGSQTKPLMLEGVLTAYEQTQGKFDLVAQALEEGRLSTFDLLKIQEKLAQTNRRTIDKSMRETGLAEVKVYHFAVIAYLCFYPINSGIQAVVNTEANRSQTALRGGISPKSKRKRFFASFLPIITIHVALTLLFFLFFRFAINSIEAEAFWTLILMVSTTLAGLLTGTAITSIFSFNEGVLTAIAIAFPLILGFSSGLMSSSIRHLITSHLPWFHKINPIGSASTGLFILNSGGGLDRFFPYLQSILIYCLVMVVITVLGLRRTRYESL